jgi:hypothetical protein
MTLDANQIIAIYQKLCKIEQIHHSLKLNASLAKSPARTETTHINHFVVALWVFITWKIRNITPSTEGSKIVASVDGFLGVVGQSYSSHQDRSPERRRQINSPG